MDWTHVISALLSVFIALFAWLSVRTKASSGTVGELRKRISEAEKVIDELREELANERALRRKAEAAHETERAEWQSKLLNVVNELLATKIRVSEDDAKNKELSMELIRLRRAMVELDHPVIVAATYDGSIVYASDEIDDLLGYGPRELIGKNVKILVDRGGDVQRHVDAMERAVTSGLTRDPSDAIISSAKHKNGSPVKVRVSLIMDAENKQFVATIRRYINLAQL